MCYTVFSWEGIMKKLYVFLIVLVFISSCSKKSEVVISQAEPVLEQESSAEVTEDVKPLYSLSKDDVLKIWVRDDFAPAMYLDENGVLRGFYVDLEKAIMKEMGQKYQLIPYGDVLSVIESIKSGEAHSAIGAPDLPTYRSLANISSHFITLDYFMFIHEDTVWEDFNNSDEAIESLFGKRVGVQVRAHTYQMLVGYGQIELVEYPTSTVALEALNKKEVDVVFEVTVAGNYYAKQNNWKIRHFGDTVFSLNLGTAFSKTLDLSVVERYNIALEKLIKSGFVENLYKTYYN